MVMVRRRRRHHARQEESGDLPRYVLKLYVAGVTAKSSVAIRAITALCQERLAGRYELEIVDLYQRPSLARGEQIIAAPTLIRKLPLPLRRLIGDMSDLDSVLVGLDLRPNHETTQ
jgi:circadian clock protein KaiB